MDLKEILARMGELRPVLDGFITRMDSDNEDDALTDEESAEFVARSAEWTTLDEQREALEAEANDPIAIRDRIRESVANHAAAATPDDDAPQGGTAAVGGDGGTTTLTRTAPVITRTDPFDIDAINRSSSTDLVSRAMSAVEVMPDSGGGDPVREVMTRMLEQEDPNTGLLPETILATTSPAYKSAFARVLRQGGIPYGFTPEEEVAWRFAERMAAVYRAMGADTDSAGGYLIPTDIEGAVTLSADGTDMAIYNLARKAPTTGTTYRVVTSPNNAWSWDGENTEVSDDSAALANTDIPLYSANGFVPVSIEARASIPGIMGNVRTTLMGGWADLVAVATTTGTGSSQPTGIITALIGGSSEIETAASGTFAVADVYSVHEGLAQRHRRRATWCAHITNYNRTRKFATDDGHSLWTRIGAGTPESLLGRPVAEVEEMDSSADAGDEIMLFGDFQHYVVAEGIGTLVEVIPHVFGSNGRPIGARGLYAKTRLGADSVLDAAFRVLQVKA